MAFRRAAALGECLDHTVLTHDMVGIGMNFAAESNPSAPIEENLVHASAVGSEVPVRRHVGYPKRALTLLVVY